MIAAEPQKTSTINPIDELHNKAMHLADEAFHAKRKEDFEAAQSKYKAAFEYEKAAAMLLINSYETEPSRSVLFRSAACLLLNLPTPNPSDYREAERMIAFGLSGYPPAEIAVELREVFEEVKEKWNSDLEVVDCTKEE
ncbi:MAG: hypothetical protein R3E32_20435 [Chitinophagales bacterium]